MKETQKRWWKGGRDREGMEEGTEVERKDRKGYSEGEMEGEREMKKIPVIRLLYVRTQVVVKG